MKYTSEQIPESCKMKQDYQLQNELRELFKAYGLDPILSVERRRGRIKVQCDGMENISIISAVVIGKHPDFSFKSFENGFVLFTDDSNAWFV